MTYSRNLHDEIFRRTFTKKTFLRERGSEVIRKTERARRVYNRTRLRKPPVANETSYARLVCSARRVIRNDYRVNELSAVDERDAAYTRCIIAAGGQLHARCTLTQTHTSLRPPRRECKMQMQSARCRSGEMSSACVQHKDVAFKKKNARTEMILDITHRVLSLVLTR